MTSSKTLDVATQLDAHHLPETNGRIPVCRRCGARTDDVVGSHHIVSEGQAVRSSEWLDAQARLWQIEQARIARAR
jgi:hypothetical protein